MALNFPNSPTSGDIFTSGGLTYQYNGTVWVSVNVKTNNAYNLANTAFDKANTATTIGSVAFDKANTANITADVAFARANAANLIANLAFDKANTATTIGSVAFDKANTANITADSSFSRANAANLVANLAFDKANTAALVASGAYDKANSANIIADSAFARANAANLIANLAFDKANSVFLPSVTRLSVTNNGSSAYLIDQYAENNPTIYINAGETIAFNLNVTGHPFMIRVSSGSTNYDTGLTHVATDGTVSTKASAQGQVTGTLSWKVPFELASNNYVYQCSIHGGMVGTIRIGQPNAIILTHANAAFDKANIANVIASSAFDKANIANVIASSAFDKANTSNNLPVQKSGTLIGSRNILNLIEGTNVTLTIADDSVGDRINVTIASSGGGGGDIGPAFDKANIANVIASSAFDKANIANVIASAAFDAANAASGGSVSDAYNQANTARSQANAAFDQANTSNNLPVQKSGTLIGSRNVLNLIEGTNVTLTVTDDSVGNRINVTIASSGGGGGGGSGNSISQTPTQLLASANGLIYTSSTFATSGDASVKKYMLIGTTTSNAPLRLVHGGGNGLIPVPSNTTMQYTVDLVARRTDAINESAGWTLKGVADNFSETVADVGNLYEIIIARDDSNYSVDVAANNTSKSLDVIVTGINSETIRWLAFVQTLEVSQ